MRLLKTTCWLAVAGLLAERAAAFSLIGPPGVGGDAWQTAALAFQPLPGIDTLPEAPKNLGEEYRRNTPTLYYAFDANFLDYFGSKGADAVEQAISVFNNITNVDSTNFLAQFPTITRRQNFQAEVLGLTDLKSITMQLLLEQLGVSEPERYTWVIHGRAVFTPPPCPGNVEYQIVQRNFDPVTFSPSSYVNGTLYSFVIEEFCTPLVPSGILADAAEFPVDPLADAWTAVAGLHGDLWFPSNAGLIPGRFFTGLTRDDAGCLRYLMMTNNINWESTGPGTSTFITNTTTPAILVTSNLNVFLSQVQTNDAATLEGLYPGLAITSSSNWFATVVTTNVEAFTINDPSAPYVNPPEIVFRPVRTTNIVQFFHHVFANVVTNTIYPTTRVTTETIGFTAPATAPYTGLLTPETNSVTQTVNQPSGDFYIIPTNLCGIDVINTNLLATPVQVVTTNTFAVTNLITTTNLTTPVVTFTTNYTVTYYTNHTIVYYPVTCPTNVTQLYEGIQHVQFVRANYDSLLGRYFQPITNEYTLYAVTNSTVQPETVERVITAPDMLFTAQDTSGAGNAIAAVFTRNLTFNSANAGAGLAGPGTIESPTVVTFNKAGPTYESLTGSGALNPLTAEANALQFPLLIWGSFDGSTNPPTVYPDGTSIQNLENSILLHPDIPTGMLAPATNGVPYSLQFTGSGGQPPYTWSLSPASPGLPPGLSLSTDGLLSGTPTQSGTFDFVVEITDSASPPRSVEWNYQMLIRPPSNSP